MTRKAKEDAFLKSGDVSRCPRCGETEHIWHTWGKDKKEGLVVGMACTRCFWHCGTETLVSTILCKFLELQEEWHRKEYLRERYKRMRRELKKIYTREKSGMKRKDKTT